MPEDSITQLLTEARRKVAEARLLAHVTDAPATAALLGLAYDAVSDALDHRIARTSRPEAIA
jgi:hypothetical protein